MAATVAEHGFAAASVSAVCARAGVSRQTFYECFGDREQCFRAILDDGYAESREIIIRSFETAGSWREGFRDALASMLFLFESNPELARVWVLDSLAAGPWALEHRERKVGELTRDILRHWQVPADVGSHPMAVPTVMAGILATIQDALRSEAKPLIMLLGPLMGIATSPFVGAGEVAAEVAAGDRLAAEIAAGARTPRGFAAAPAVELPAALAHPRALRLRACLLYLASEPGASNRRIARAIGVTSDAHISALVSRLVELGLVTRTNLRRGLANDCRLSAKGELVAAELGRLLDD